MDYNEAFEWWLEQGDNDDYEVVRRANVDFGDVCFVEIVWKHKEKGGRDRIYKRCGGGYEMFEVYG
jgi:hypothetical protein